MIANAFSKTWRDLFLADVPAVQGFRERLCPHGRVIVDLYNRDHAISRPLIERARRGDVTVETRRTWSGPRLQLELHYDGVPGDRFDWHVYSPQEFAALCREVGLDVAVTCAWFDPAIAASPEHARMQFVLEKIRLGGLNGLT